MLPRLPPEAPLPDTFVAAGASSGWRSAGQAPSGARTRVVSSASAAASASVAAPVEIPLKGEIGRSGGGDGDGPTPGEQLQVISYRVALVLTALCWWLTYTLDFFMTSGVTIIDPGMQLSALLFGDVCAGFAALIVPTGSFLLAGVVLRLLGLATLASVALGAVGAGKVGSLLGPICMILICAREVLWFGLAFKGDAAFAVVLFATALFLRASYVFDGVEPEAGASTGTNGRDITLLRQNEVQWLSRWQELELPPYSGSVPPVGPPLPVSFLISASLTVLSFGKAFATIGEDLDEEGEQFFKQSSVFIDDDRDYAKSTKREDAADP